MASRARPRSGPSPAVPDFEAGRQRLSDEVAWRVLEVIPDALMVVDDAWKYVFINERAARYLRPGVPADELLGRTLWTEHPELMGGDREAALRHAMISRESVEYEARDPASGEWFRVRAVAAGPGLAITFQDITAWRQAQDGQQVARERLQEIERLREVDRFKTRVLRATSHELNTPLTPLKLQIHMLKSGALGDLNGRQYKSVEVLGRNLGRLEFLVRDMLDVARLDSGRLMVRKTRVELDETVREALEGFNDPARRSNIALDAKLAYGRFIEVDRQRLMQVLFNLLGNALKFTPDDGHIRVRTFGDDHEVQIVVEDDGAGIAHEDQAKLFRPFSQVHDPMEQTHAGIGLGLYICRGICEAHGGTIRCESDGPGKGSRFIVTLPVGEPSAT